MTRPALFLDRDGTLIVHRPYLADPAGVELLPQVREALHRFVVDGWRLFLFTNQSGVGRGYFTLEAARRCNERMEQLLDLPGGGFTETCIAPETPEMPQVYRKPSPRFIREMMARYALAPEQTWMVGDKVNDVMTGLNAGVRAALVHGAEDEVVPAGVPRCHGFRDLYEMLQRLQAGRMAAP
jgi:D-glycero-D-manno-heptose 1,7-bisphosphate phosphatase